MESITLFSPWRLCKITLRLCEEIATSADKHSLLFCFTSSPSRRNKNLNKDLAKTELNWIPQYNIDDMMLSAWKWENHLEEQNTK